MRIIQQLAYDGNKLYCPIHPQSQLREAATSDQPSREFCKTCFAPVEAGMPCYRSACWPSREAMEQDLTQEGDQT